MMEREIKFRWFRKRTNEMVYDLVTEVYPDGSFGTVEDSEHTIFAGIFTGLKDKNGTDIYEGDICTDGETKAVVAYEVQAGCYWLKWKVQTMQRTINRYKDLAYGGQEGWQNEIRLTGIEIIGNAHESPELLTQLEKK